MQIEQSDSSTPTSVEVRDALIYARTAIAREREYAAAIDAKGHRQVQMAWHWFAVVQVVLAFVLSFARPDAPGSLWLALVAAGFSALALGAVVVFAYLLWSVPDHNRGPQMALLDILMIRGARDEAIDTHDQLFEATASELSEGRRANARRDAWLGALAAAWVATMLLAGVELIALMAVLAEGYLAVS